MTVSQELFARCDAQLGRATEVFQRDHYIPKIASREPYGHLEVSVGFVSSALYTV